MYLNYVILLCISRIIVGENGTIPVVKVGSMHLGLAAID